MNKSWNQVRFSSFSSSINCPRFIMNKNQINRSDEDFELMGDMPKEDPVIAEVKTFFINNISKKNHFSVVFYGKMK